jgi:hypothetical protein
MTKLLVLGSAAAVLVGAATIGASAGRVSGIVAAKSATSLEIATKAEGTKEVGLDEKTDYVKWVTARPWQQDARASASTVTAGSCVDVELRSAGGSIAKMVRVNTEPAGSMFDPCKTMRR